MNISMSMLVSLVAKPHEHLEVESQILRWLDDTYSSDAAYFNRHWEPDYLFFFWLRSMSSAHHGAVYEEIHYALTADGIEVSDD